MLTFPVEVHVMAICLECREDILKSNTATGPGGSMIKFDATDRVIVVTIKTTKTKFKNRSERFMHIINFCITIT